MHGNKPSLRQIIAWVIIALLCAFFVVMEIYVRVIGRLSSSAENHIESVTHNYPVVIGIIWTAIIVLAVSMAWHDYRKSGSKSKLIKLIAWLTFLLGMVTYAFISMITSP